MADYRETYFWLLWMLATTLFSYFYFPFKVTLSFFLAGIIIISKILAEEYLENQEDVSE